MMLLIACCCAGIISLSCFRMQLLASYSCDHPEGDESEVVRCNAAVTVRALFFVLLLPIVFF